MLVVEVFGWFTGYIMSVGPMVPTVPSAVIGSAESAATETLYKGEYK